jgi:hypothetical protein
MTSEKLNMTGRKLAVDLLQSKAKVYFYKPPSQQEAARLGRKAKHCQHYHGPAEIVRKIGTQSYVLSYQGRTYQRDQGMIIPAKHRVSKGKLGIGRAPIIPPHMHAAGSKPEEGEHVLILGGPNDKDWYCAEIAEVLVDRIVINYHTTATPPPENYEAATPLARKSALARARFLKTWIKRPSGLPTIIAPRLSRIHKNLYQQRIPLVELDQHLLVRNVSISAKGRLSLETVNLAAALSQPHHLGAGG